MNSKDIEKSEKIIDHSIQNMTQKYTEEVLGFSWENFFPYKFQDIPFKVKISNLEIFKTFAQSNFKDIFKQDLKNSPFIWFEESLSKNRYYERSGDFFSFHEEKSDHMVGVFVGTLSDWSTYYLRNVAILPEFQGQKIFQCFLEYFVDCLEDAGVDRVEGEISVSNLINIHNLIKLGFFVSGQVLTERWGAMVRLVKYLNMKHEHVFLSQFSHTTSQFTKK